MIKTFLHRTKLLNTKLWFWWEKRKELQTIKRQAKRRKRKIKEAELRHQSDGKRYYVLPDANGTLHALNQKEIEHLKKIGIMTKSVNINTLLKEAVYHTK